MVTEVKIVLYIVCEDSKSGFKLWKHIEKVYNKHYKGKDTAQAVTAKGKDKIYSLITEKLKPVGRDRVLVTVDKVDDTDFSSLLKSLTIDSQKNGYGFELTRYYCIEEIFLSFLDLKLWLGIYPDANSMYLTQVQKYIWDYSRHSILDTTDNSVDTPSYFVEPYKVYRDASLENKISRYFKQEYFKERGRQATTREQMASFILGRVTRSYNKGFRVTKGLLGKCWFNDSIKSGRNRQESEKFCSSRNCYIYSKNKCETTGEEKLLTFWNKSIAYLYMGNMLEHLYKVGRH